MCKKNLKKLLFIVMATMIINYNFIMATDEIKFITSPEYISNYIKNNGIKEIKFSSKSTVLKKINELSEKLEKNLEPLFFLEESYKGLKKTYKITNKKTDLMYIGQQKDNKPHGIGSLFEIDEKGVFVKYGGQFKEGVSEGYGQYFNIPTKEDINDYIEVYGIEAIEFMDERLNYVIYEGEFKNNKFNGKGQFYNYPSMYEDYIFINNKIKDEISEFIKKPIILDYINIAIGDFKDDKLNGKVKIYMKGKLLYDGEMKNGKYNGKGILKFENSNQVEYDGQFKNGKYEGKGKLFDKNGKLLYSGKWKNGDYN